MNSQLVFASIMLFVGLAGFITTMVLGLIYNFGIATICLLVFFFLIAVIGLVHIINISSEKSNEDQHELSCYL